MTRNLLLAGLALLVCYMALVVIANRWRVPWSGPVAVAAPPSQEAAGPELSVAIWNVGYGALDDGMDFVADRGSRWLPRSRAAVIENVAGIGRTLAEIDADVVMLQEVARASPLNLGVDVIEGLQPHLAGRAFVFDAEVASRLLPPPLRVAHGGAIYSRVGVEGAERRLITGEDEWLGGLLKRDYRLLTARLATGAGLRPWLVINVHLAAFDEAAAVRRRQLADVIAFAVAEHGRGHAVIVGGDWNLELTRDRFAHAAPPGTRFWLHDFPASELPPGWSMAFDRDVPSVRTLDRPYVPGQTYVSVVDAFLVSPGIDVVSVSGRQLGFRHSDHQPVVGRFRQQRR